MPNTRHKYALLAEIYFIQEEYQNCIQSYKEVKDSITNPGALIGTCISYIYLDQFDAAYNEFIDYMYNYNNLDVY